MISRIFISLGTIALPGAAWAHPGHVADLGQGHSHWPALIILGGLAIATLAWMIVSAISSVRRRHQP